MNRPSRSAALAVLVALAVSACASSLQRDTEVASGRGAPADGRTSAQGTATTPTSAHPPGAGDESAPTPSDAGVDTGSTVAEPGRPSSGGGAGTGVRPTETTTGPGGDVAMGRGVTADTITVGVVVIDWAGLQNVQGYSTGNPRVQAQAIADHINANGGIRGRTLNLVFEEMSAGSANIDADEQRMCAGFTQDHQVFAAVAGMMTMGKTLIPCLARSETPFIHGAGALHDETSFGELGPYLFYPGGPSLTRMAGFYVDGLADQGFFQPATGEVDVRIGLVRVDDAPYARATAEVIEPRLRQLGLELAEEAAVNATTSLGDTASRMFNVTLRFQQRGINRVLFLDNAQLGALFAIQAAQTSYYPRYGLNTTTIPNTMQNNVPARALRGSMGVGWQPAIDVNRAYEDVTPAANVCYSIMAAAGQSNVDRSGEWQQRNFCDELLFLDFMLERADALTAGGLAGAVAAAGGSYPSTLNWQSDFKGGRPDGASTARYFAFVDQCSCFQYTGPVRNVG